VTEPHGHADRATQQVAGRLADTLRANLDVPVLLDLAQLWIEPMHREEDAATLVGYVLLVQPGQPRAAVFSAYLALHYWMDDEHLRAAAALLREVLAAGHEVGAAALLLDEILRQLGPDAADANIDLLRQSVAAEPTWSVNRVRLSRALAARGDTPGALAELDAAIATMIDPDTPMEPLVHSYHSIFTGRTDLRHRLIAQRATLAAG
jgi:hypothetical protein